MPEFYSQHYGVVSRRVEELFQAQHSVNGAKHPMAVVKAEQVQ
jgi:hypothetical protein